MKKYFIFITFLALGCSSSKQTRKIASVNQTGNSIFCHVNTSDYRQCNYRTLEKCNQARRYLEGICIKNEIQDLK